MATRRGPELNLKNLPSPQEEHCCESAQNGDPARDWRYHVDSTLVISIFGAVPIGGRSGPSCSADSRDRISVVNPRWNGVPVRCDSRTWRIVALSAGIRSPCDGQKERTLIGPAEAPPTRATSSRNAGRNHLGTPSDIKSEWWATSSRIRGDFPRNQHSPIGEDLGLGDRLSLTKKGVVKTTPSGRRHFALSGRQHGQARQREREAGPARS